MGVCVGDFLLVWSSILLGFIGALRHIYSGFTCTMVMLSTLMGTVDRVDCFIMTYQQDPIVHSYYIQTKLIF